MNQVKIETIKESDFDEIVMMVTDIAEKDILPHFSEEGKAQFASGIPNDIRTAFDMNRFYAVKAVLDEAIVGIAALRDLNYLTHLFVSKQKQGQGIGKQLLEHVIKKSSAKEVSLRASVNAASFYESQGFVAKGPESSVKGVRFVPMSINTNSGT